MITTLSHEEVCILLNEAAYITPYKMHRHSFVPLDDIGKNYCPYCGLVALNNSATSWCMQKGCNYRDHPQYKTKMKQIARKLRESKRC